MTSTHRAIDCYCALQDYQSLPPKKGRSAPSSQAQHLESREGKRKRKGCAEVQATHRVQDLSRSFHPASGLFFSTALLSWHAPCFGSPQDYTTALRDFVHRLYREDCVQGRVSIWWLNVLLTNVLTTAPS